ncbi:MAG TPA: xanthine dehydrogenase family protein molybdopterin-binding subunit [Stellaceae bacterium]|nr:xanthine dehydrogenase family protein molybdopterin-binding subunit [Stellaceae bacterium]
MTVTQRIGAPVPRKEDERLLRGRGCYSDDVNLPGQAYAAFVRSPHAHARIAGINAADARALPGVLAVLSGADVAADRLNSIPHRPVTQGGIDIQLHNSDGSEPFRSPHLPLPSDRARFVGEAVAMVVAESVAAAKDAAERVMVRYEPLPPVTATAAAAAPGAPRLYDEARSNTCIDAMVGDRAATEAAFARAAHRVRLETWIQRVTGVPMEPRAAVASFDPATGRYWLHAGSGGTNRQKLELARILDVKPELVQVVAREVGGNFGTRNAFYPEFALVAWAARRIGRPVKWTCERSEAFASDYQGRDLLVEAELALDADGNFLALRGSNLSNVGAHTVSFVPLTKGVGLMSGVYRVPAASFRARAALSDTPSTNPYRSAGRPEAMFVIERLIDLAARRCGFDRVALRRRNLVPERAMPYANPLGVTYDSGAYEQVMDKALALADWDGYPARRAASLARGRRRGIGLANYVEITTGQPREWTKITVRPEGAVEVAIGTLSSGQGHETSFAQCVTEWLGVPFESVRLVTGDTDIVPVGGGSQSGRSMRLASIVMGIASDAIIARGKRIAAHLLEAAEADIGFRDGRFVVEGTDRALGIFEAARAAQERTDLPEALRGPLEAVGDETVRVAGYPYGSHVCEVEVDPETGQVEIVRYAAVDDVGRAVNPLILHGQAHGGIAQGAGQALLEQCHYDPETGQLLSGSLMDYALPRADTMPAFATEISEVPSPTNRLGVRAGGEGGTTPALGAVINAIVDALAAYGVEHIEMPATPERVWRAINHR